MSDRNSIPKLSTSPSGMVRPIVPGSFNPELPAGSRGNGELSDGPCRGIQASADGTISYYDYTLTLIENFPVKAYDNPFGVVGVTVSDVDLWAIY